MAILWFISDFCSKMTSRQWCERELVVDWNNFIREVCCHSLQKEGYPKTGGDEIIVEVNESMRLPGEKKIFLVVSYHNNMPQDEGMLYCTRAKPLCRNTPDRD